MTDFGYNTIGTGGNDNVSNSHVWLKATSTPASSGTLTQIQVYCEAISFNATISLALYTDSGGKPGSLVVAGDASPVSVTTSAFGWISQSLSASITGGTQYWFGIRVPNGDSPPNGTTAFDVNVKFDTNGSVTEGYFSTPNPGAPDTTNWESTAPTVTGFANERWSIYGSYTPAGGGPPERMFFGVGV